MVVCALFCNLNYSLFIKIVLLPFLDLPPSSLEGYQGCVEAIAALSAGEPVKEDDLILIGELPDDSVTSGQFYSVLREELLKLLEDPVLTLIELRDEDRKAGMKFSMLFAAAQFKNNPKVSCNTVLIMLIIDLEGVALSV